MRLLVEALACILHDRIIGITDNEIGTFLSIKYSKPIQLLNYIDQVTTNL